MANHTSVELSLDAAPAGLGETLRQQGFERFTAVQEAVLNSDLGGRDLRISSETGSGKTVALGLLLAEEVAEAAQASGEKRGPASPVALLVAPTRELAGQLGREFRWLYRPLGARVLVVTGGTSVREEQRSLKQRPHVVIGTPGRLVDHMRSRSLQLDSLRTLALDEADEMLDMNFEEELNVIVDAAPEERTTHLVSATFPRAVARLADRFQSNPATVEGTALGKPNADIAHIVMRVYAAERYDAVANILLRYPDDKTLIFVRTRADTLRLATHLSSRGLPAQALNGEMTQRERSATFAAFRRGSLRFLVGTDVAARGLDVQDIARVIQVDLPENEEVLIHRSGRTGRAGRSGDNILFVPPRAENRARTMLRAARVSATELPVPTPAEIRRGAEDRISATLESATEEEAPSHRRWQRLAERLLQTQSPEEVVSWLLEKSNIAGLDGARELRTVRQTKSGSYTAKAKDTRRGRSRPGSHAPLTTFQVSWGAAAGADKRRLLAIVCRRGGVSSEQVGAIRINENSASVEITTDVAEQFERSVARPDKRNPRVKFRRWKDNGKKASRKSSRKAPRKGRGGVAHKRATVG